MRAIQIDSSDINIEAVREVKINNYKDYYPLLNCELFTVVMVQWEGEDISIFIDDEGLLKAGNYGRMVEDYPEPLFGNMVICGGVDGEGETKSLPRSFNVMNIMQYIDEIKYQVRG